MKAKVIKAYNDRLEGVKHVIGETIETTEGRAKELMAGGFIEIIEEQPKEEKAETPKAEAKPKATRKKVTKA